MSGPLNLILSKILMHNFQTQPNRIRNFYWPQSSDLGKPLVIHPNYVTPATNWEFPKFDFIFLKLPIVWLALEAGLFHNQWKAFLWEGLRWFSTLQRSTGIYLVIVFA